MGIMLLRKQGKLSYEDTLRKFFPELPYRNISIRQLMHHTSGLPDYMDLVMTHWDTSKVATNKDMIALLAEYHPRIHFAPGEKWEYSNTGYALLASIIEHVSKMSFSDYLNKYIFQPLGMNRTMVFRRRYENKIVPNYAYGYIYDTKLKKYILPDESADVKTMVYSLDGIVGDGTVNSTTNDLLKWDRALYTEKLVSKQMLAEAFQPGLLNNDKKTAYGFGWAVGESKMSGRILNHGGGWPGYSTFIERHIDSDKTIIVLRNYETTSDPLQKIRNILYDVKESDKKEMSVTANQLQQYIGEVRVDAGFCDYHNGR